MARFYSMKLTMIDLVYDITMRIVDRLETARKKTHKAWTKAKEVAQ